MGGGGGGALRDVRGEGCEKKEKGTLLSECVCCVMSRVILRKILCVMLCVVLRVSY